MLCTRIRISASGGAERECRCLPPFPVLWKGVSHREGKEKKMFSPSRKGEGAPKGHFFLDSSPLRPVQCMETRAALHSL